jgi:Spy/CpxP family protein refolding chaperone
MSTNDQQRSHTRPSFGRRVRHGLIALAGATLMLGGLAACSHIGPHHGDMSQMSAEDQARMRQHMSDRVSRELSLDDAQKQRLGVLFDKLAEQRKTVVGAETDPRAKVRTLLAGNTFDRAGAQQLVDQKTGAVRTAAPELITAFGDFYDSLKPEQQQKLRDWMDKRGGRRWFGGHMG